MVEMLPTAFLLVLAGFVVVRANHTCDGPCGLRYKQQGGVRIVGGHSTTSDAWPWMVSLQVFSYQTSQRFHQCGGSLINPSWVLSAAHCFKTRKDVYDWRVILGAKEMVYGTNKPVRPPEQERYIERIITHEKYDPTVEINDIALLKITPPVTCGNAIGTGCLPHPKAGPPKIPQSCWVTGWGYMKENAGKSAPTLQEARVDLINLELCNSSRWYNGRIHLTNLCAGYPEGSIDTCQGDSGGPLMCRDSATNIFVIVGLTSWGVGCARAKRPGVYTSTWHYLNWISSKMGASLVRQVQLEPPASPPGSAASHSSSSSSSSMQFHRPSSTQLSSWDLSRPSQMITSFKPGHLVHSLMHSKPQVSASFHFPPRPPQLPSISFNRPASKPASSPFSKPISTTYKKPSQKISFAKRLEQLIETLKSKNVILSAKNFYEIETTDIPEVISHS